MGRCGKSAPAAGEVAPGHPQKAYCGERTHPTPLATAAGLAAPARARKEKGPGLCLESADEAGRKPNRFPARLAPAAQAPENSGYIQSFRRFGVHRAARGWAAALPCI